MLWRRRIVWWKRSDRPCVQRGDRLALVNPTPSGGKVVLKGLEAKRLLELGRGRTCERSFFGRSFEIDVLPYDLLVFEKEKQ